MDFDYPESQRRVYLTTACGVGALGREIVAHLELNLSLLPEAVLRGVSIGTTDEPAGVGDEVARARSELSRVENVNEIGRRGWDVAGRDAGRIFVRHVIVGNADSLMSGTPAIVEDLGRRCPTDRVHVIVVCESVDAELERLNWELPGSLMLVGEQQRTGLTVGPSSLVAAVAGFLLLMLLPETSKGFDQDLHGPTSFGLAGFQGLAGASLKRMADLLALGVLCTQTKDASDLRDAAELRKPLQEFVEDYSPRHLGTRLFDERLQTDLRPRPIPAAAEWQGQILKIRLDRGSIALQLAEDNEREWSNQIRRFSRGFDMSLASVWRQKLDRAGDALEAEVSDSFLSRFHNLLEKTPFAPSLIGSMLSAVGEELEAEYRPMDEATGDLETALDAMDREIEKQPNLLALTGRLAVWLVPALLGLPALLFGLYEPVRSWLFSGGVVLTGLVSGVCWLLYRYSSARRKVLKSRDWAIELLVRRQEALLSENAVGCLHEIAAAVKAQSQKAREMLVRYTGRIDEEIELLQASTSECLPEDPVIAPVLATPEEYDRLLQEIRVNHERWLQSAIEEGCFRKLVADDFAKDQWLNNLALWCCKRIADGGLDRVPTYGDMWKIRCETRRAGGMLETSEELWNRADLLADGPVMGSGDALIVVPKELMADVRNAFENGGQGSPVDVVESTTVPLMCCLRRGLLQHRWTGERGRS